MINIVLIAAIALLALGGLRSFLRRSRGESCCCGGREKKASAGPSDRNRRNYHFVAECGIGGMKCGACASRIQSALNLIDGVWARKVSARKGSAVLLLKKEGMRETVEKAIFSLGYKLSFYEEKAL